MTLATATPPVVRALVHKLRAKSSGHRIIGVHAQPVWHHDAKLSADSAAVLVRPCVSALAVREAIASHQDDADGSYLVVVTDCTSDDLGAGIRAHLAGNRLVEVDLWDTVQESFRAPHLDPSFVRRDKEWAPRALVDNEPSGGWSEAPGGTLSRDLALSQLAGVVLGVDESHIDATSLLGWSLDAVAVGRWLDLPAETRAGLGGWLEEKTGAAGRLTLRCAAAGHAADAVALALTAGLLWHRDADAGAVGMARGMLAARVGGEPPTPADAQAWNRTATQFVAGELADNGTRGGSIVERAEQLLDELGAGAVVPLSRFLPRALDYRLGALATALTDVLPAPTAASLGRVEETLDAVHDHELAGTEPRVDRAAMAVRLTRWIATSAAPGSPTETADTLAAALDRQMRVDAWVDRAYADIFTGDQDPGLTSAYAALAAAVSLRRAAHDAELATLLAEVTSTGAALGRIVPVERALSGIIHPLASAERGVLLVVIDGMSSAVATEIAEGLAARRWTELVDGAVGARQALLPVLPTVTEVSRTSLLTGMLRKGSAADEKRHFAEAVGLAARLFHKDDLRAPAGAPLAPDVARAIADPAVRVVGVVLNTVDDTLDKMDPGGTTWTVESVQHLPALLDAARAADRVVVLTSDHGHVVERGGTLRSYPDATSARWRPSTSPAVDGEIVVSGARVQLGAGSVVLPWREEIRYTAKRAGYHGGASAAEVTVPLTVHVRGPVDQVAGWLPAVPPEPAWWHSPLAPGRTSVTSVTSVPAASKHEDPTLFDVSTMTSPRSPASVDDVELLLDALFQSATYDEQRRKAGRSAPDDARVRAILSALLCNDGRLHETTLAAEALIPAARVRNVLAAVRKLLNVEGYEVLGMDSDQVTVLVDLALLREQFHLGRAT